MYKIDSLFFVSPLSQIEPNPSIETPVAVLTQALMLLPLLQPSLHLRSQAADRGTDPPRKSESETFAGKKTAVSCDYKM